MTFRKIKSSRRNLHYIKAIHVTVVWSLPTHICHCGNSSNCSRSKIKVSIWRSSPQLFFFDLIIKRRSWCSPDVRWYACASQILGTWDICPADPWILGLSKSLYCTFFLFFRTQIPIRSNCCFHSIRSCLRVKISEMRAIPAYLALCGTVYFIVIFFLPHPRDGFFELGKLLLGIADIFFFIFLLV